MTCIVGIETKSGVLMGGDSAAVNDILNRTAEPKVFVRGKFLIGYTTSFRMGQLLQFTLNAPKQKVDSDMEYMCTTFIDAVKECFTLGGFSGEEDGEGGTFLVGYHNKLYYVQDDFAVIRSPDGYKSCGYGMYAAKASLDMSGKFGLKPRRRLELALEAVQELYPSYVTAPFHYVKLKG